MTKEAILSKTKVAIWSLALRSARWKLAGMFLLVFSCTVFARENKIESVKWEQLDSKVVIRVKLKNALDKAPLDFKITSPAHIVLNFEDVGNDTGITEQRIDLGDVRSLQLVPAKNRMILVFNLVLPSNYVAKTDGDTVILTIERTNELIAGMCGKIPADEVGKTMNPDDATDLSRLARRCKLEQKYEQAKSLYERVLVIRQTTLVPDQPEVAESLSELADLYYSHFPKFYANAELLFKRALDIREKTFGEDAPITAQSLDRPALLYTTEAKYEQAEPLFQRALTIRLKTLAEDDPIVSQSHGYLGELYFAQQKFALASNQWKSLAEHGNKYAQQRMGEIYRIGQPTDFAEAVRWYRLAAEQGDAEGQLNLAGMYFLGQGVKQDFEEAAKWTLKSAEQGNIMAEKTLAQIYLEGKGFSENASKAAEWFDKAAIRGDLQAQISLGVMYENGRGVTQDVAHAARLYRNAADQGLAEAQYRLGLLYAQGMGVPVDYKLAESMWEKAAAQGFENAKQQLATWRDGGSASCNDKRKTTPDKTEDMLPLKPGLWKVESVVSFGSVALDADKRKTCSNTTSLCVTSEKDMPQGKFWPEKSEDSEGCIKTIFSNTENLQDYRMQCADIFDTRMILRKSSDEDYLLEYHMRFTPFWAPLLVTPPVEANAKINFRYAGACNQ